MKFKNNTYGFSLLELVVLITIIAIITTISFVSYSGYTENTRDSIRISTISELNKSLETNYIESSDFVVPDNINYTGQILGSNIIYLGDIGAKISILLGFNDTPVDPLTNKNYLYGVSSDKKQFQVTATLEANKYNSTSLSGNNISIVQGKYNGYLVYKNNLGKSYLTNIPSLVLSQNSNSDLFSSGAFFINNNGFNLSSQESPFTPVLTSEVLSEIHGPGVILSNIDISTCIKNNEKIFTDTTISNFGKNNYDKFILKNPKYLPCKQNFIPEVIANIDENTDLYTLGSEIFSSGATNYLTDNWKINDCSSQILSINNTLFTGGEQYINNSLTLTGNTIYKVPNGNYHLNGSTSNTNGYITFGGDCIGLIGSGTGTTKFISEFSSGGNKNAGVFGMRGWTGTRKNLIISGFTLDNNKLSLNRYNYGIYGDDKISNISLHNIEVNNSKSYGVIFDDDANDNLLSKITSYNNDGYGLGITFNSKRNKLNEIETYSNLLGGVLIDYNSSQNTLENIISYNNTNNGLFFDFTSTGNTISGALLYSNTKNGLYVKTSSSDSIFNNITSYSNLNNGLYIDNNSSNNIFSNITSYSNSINGLYIDINSNNNTFNNLVSYSNLQKGINLLGGDNNQFLNGNIYNNTRHGIYIYTKNNSFNNFNIFNNNIVNNSSYYAFEIDASVNGNKYNSLNNLNIFNNNKNGLLIQPNSDTNLLNNLNIFNNTGTTDGGAGFYVSSNSTGSIFNNISTYNNQNSFTSYASQITKPTYYGTFKYFGNTFVSNGGGTFSTNLIAGIGHPFFTNGNSNTTGTMGCDWHIRPNNTSLYGATCTTRGKADISSIIPISSFNFGVNVPKQQQPVKWDGTSWIRYGSTGIDYNTTKFIGEF